MARLRSAGVGLGELMVVQPRPRTQAPQMAATANSSMPPLSVAAACPNSTP